MNIFLQEYGCPSGKKRTLLKTDGNDHSLLLNAIPDICREGNHYVSEEKLWDCVADLFFENILCGMKTEKVIYTGQLVILGNIDYYSDYFSPEGMISLLWNQKQGKRGRLHINKREMTKMTIFQYHVECPVFDSVDMDYRSEKSTVRAYCHPVDAKIIAVLDNPAVNAIFKTIADVGADTNLGQMLASGIPLNQKNYPEINAVIRECSECLGIRRPYAVVSPQLPGINAMTVGSDDEPCLVLSSFMVKTMSTEQLKFVVGHECGHIAMGHVVYHSAAAAAGSFSRLIPIIGPAIYSFISYPMNAWERRSEITADRAGLLCCKDLELAQRTLLQIESAYQSADGLDITSYVENSRNYLKKGVLRRMGEYNANHPLLSKRIEALSKFANSQCYYALAGQDAPKDALTDKELKNVTENIIKVL